MVEAEAERVGAEGTDEEVAEAAAAEDAGDEPDEPGDEVAGRDGTEEGGAEDEGAPADDDRRRASRWARR